MATGVRGKERIGRESVSAARPHADPHPLPIEGATVQLEYEGKLPEREILRPLSASFCVIGRQNSNPSSVKVKPNALVLADNLFAMHHLLQGEVRPKLIYFDPPFGTGMEFQSRRLQRAYKDKWDQACYLEFIRRRLILMRELLRSDGSIYVHIGHQMVGHVKVLLDEIFESRNFRNLIVRRKCSSKNFTRKQYPNLHDYILFYTKSADFTWNQPSEEPTDEWLSKEYDKRDARGQYKLVPVHAPGTRQGETGKKWRGMLPPPGKHWQFIPSKLDEFDAAGEIHWSKNGNPRRKVYLSGIKKVPLTDYWGKYRDAHHQSVHITGYPTEKNLELMKVIVAASANADDLVLDPFAGSGTTLQAANDLGRQWIGIDESFAAIEATLHRFRHGLTSMGDYVQKRVPKVVTLFDHLQRTSADNPQIRTKSDAQFDFVFDSELWAPRSYEIQALAAI